MHYIIKMFLETIDRMLEIFESVMKAHRARGWTSFS
jgi:hypothetical protein